MQVNQTDSERR